MANGKVWTKEEIEILTNGYKNEIPVNDMIKNLPGRSVSSIITKARKMGLTQKYVRKHSSKYKAVYQDYDWCYERFIERGMTLDDMASEAGCTKRVLKKWCSKIHGLGKKSFKDLKHMTELQKQIITFGTLGDGYINDTDNKYTYNERHSIEEKEYLFWKYEILKDLCHNPPSLFPATTTVIRGKECFSKPYYKFNTRVLNELIEINKMSRTEKIEQFNDLGLSLHLLDDGSRRQLWNVCLAGWSQEEMDKYQEICKSRFGLLCTQEKDKRYYLFDARSSKKIDEMILNTIPNDLDIIRKKITENNKIPRYGNYKYVIKNGVKIGLARYCKSHIGYSNYQEAKAVFESLDTDRLDEDVFLEIMSKDV